MELEKIIAISGKPGLYKMLVQSKISFIVESIETGKRLPVSVRENVSLLMNVSVYTTQGEFPLLNLYEKIFDKENKGAILSQKSPANQLRAYVLSILPDLATDRVYDSDLKKIVQWYNLLQKSGRLEALLEDFKKREEKEEAPSENQAKQEDVNKEKSGKLGKPSKKISEEAPPKKVTNTKKSKTTKEQEETSSKAEKATINKKSTAKTKKKTV